MKNYVVKFICAMTVVALCSCASKTKSESSDNPDDNYSYEIPIVKDYKALKTQDLDDMNDMVLEKINLYKEDQNMNHLREAVLLALSRSNEDFMVSKILPLPQNQLEDLGEWESTVQTLISECIIRLKSNTVSTSDKVTATIVLENLISEFKPAFTKQYQTGGFETGVIEGLAAQNISLSSKVVQEKELNQMKVGLSPFQLAKKLIDQKTKYLENQENSKKK